jgi:serine phosphatase RsbU (regulator of sigma subunit)
MDALSIEDVVATSDHTVVRRRFDSRNLVMVSVFLALFFIVCLLELATNFERRVATDVAIASTNIILVLLLAFVMRDVYRVERKGGAPEGMWAVGRWIRQHVTATVIVFFIVQYTLLVAFTRHSGDFAGWAMFFPFFLLGLRLFTPEILFIHLYLFALPAALAVINLKRDLVPVIVAMLCINVFCAALEVVLSVRMKREIAGDWRIRRSQAREQLRMRDELQYARQLQLSMLPDCAPKLDWIDIAGASVPATEVGGDYFDYFVVGDALAIVEGDVAGHGLASGIVLASLRSGFTLLRDALTDPAAVLQRLHDLVAETSRRRILVTCAVILLDPKTRRARIASAGHPPVIIRDGSETAAIELFAPPLGVRLPMNIAEHHVAFAPGDVFVLHTDGVYESANAAGESYGIERIVQVVRDRAGDDATTIRDAILRDVEEFRGGEAAADDVTVVVAVVR